MTAAGGGVSRFMRRTLATALLLSCALPGLGAYAAATPSTQQIADYERSDESNRVRLLIHLSNSGQHEIASELLARHPLQGPHATNRTLYIEGLILRASGDLTGAVKKFRAALADNPKLTMVRADLAQTLVSLEQDEGAKHHLELLAAEANSEEDAAGIRAFVDRIDSRRPYKFNAYVSLAPSTNLNSGSNHATVYSPVFGSDLTISDSNKKKSGLGVATGVNAQLRVYDDSDFNSVSLSQSAELRYHFDRGYLGLSGVASQSVDEEEFALGYTSFGPRASLRLNLTQRDVLTAASTYEWRDYTDYDSADGTAWMTDLAWTHGFGAATSASVAAGFDEVRQQLAQNSYDSWSGGLGLYKELSHGVTANLMGEVKFSKFDDVNLVAGVLREDTRYVAALGLTKRDLDFWGFAPEVSYGYVRNTSNISLYDYDSHAVDFRLTREF